MAGAGYKVWSAGDVLAAADVNTYLMEQAVMVFPGSAERTSTIATPTAGMISYLTATASLEYYNGSSWAVVNDNVDAILKNTVTTEGDLIVATGSAAVTRLGRGTAGQVLTANSTAIAWETPSANIPLTTVTAAGDLIVANGSASVTRLPIGAVGQVLTSSGTAIGWQATSGGGVVYPIASEQVISIGTAQFTVDATYIANSPNSIGINFVDSGGTVISTKTISGFEFFTYPSGVANVYVQNDNLTDEVLEIAEYTAASPTTSKKYITIGSTQDVVLDTTYLAYLIGGGGAGGGCLSGRDDSGGGGGGSGYYTFGTLTAGTYTATIGAGGAGVSGANGGDGGATTIGALTANGGSGGKVNAASATGGAGGDGGSGGAGGAGSTVSETNVTALGGVLGGNGSAGVSGTGGTGGAGGIGQGAGIPNPIAVLSFTLADPDDTGVSTNANSAGIGGLVYGGGGGGGVTLSNGDGVAALAGSYGGGGGGARGDTSNSGNATGGAGRAGRIILIEA